MSSHTVIVTSNVRDERNTSNHFYNTLGTPLDFSDGEWKVAVKKLIYFNAFLNIIDESITAMKSTSHTAEIRFDKTLKGVTYVTPDRKIFVMHYVLKPDFEQGVDIYIEKHHGVDDIIYTPVVTYVDGSTKTLTPTVVSDMGVSHSQNIIVGNRHTKTVDNLKITFEFNSGETFAIPPGNYDHLEKLLSAINALKIPGFGVEARDGVVTAKMQSPITAVRLDNHLNMTLGFCEHVTKLKKTTTARHLPQLNRGRFAFFIYSNLVNNCRVGDMEVPLMDVISIPKRDFAEIITLDVVNPVYNSVALKRVNEIEISLASDSGKPISFDNRAGNAKTLLVLHFVRAK